MISPLSQMFYGTGRDARPCPDTIALNIDLEQGQSSERKR